VIAGSDDGQQHEEGIQDSGEACGEAAPVAQQAAADDDRVADVHARYRRERVVERADQTPVQVDVGTRDGVGDSDACQSWRGGRKEDVAGESKRAREEQRRADERIRCRPPAVEPEQESGGCGQVKSQVCDAERSDESGHRVRAGLNPALEKEVQRLLQRRNFMGMSDRVTGFADDKAAGGLVAGVESEHRDRLCAKRVPAGPPPAGGPGGRTKHRMRGPPTQNPFS
jgi:hypothetical protein